MLESKPLLVGLSLLTFGSSVAVGVSPLRSIQSAAGPRALPVPVSVIQDFTKGLSSVRAANPAVRLSVGSDSELPEEPVLVVEYPAPTGDPAGRDVQCDVEHRDWTAGEAIGFHIKPAHDLRLSVSFVDRNRVVYTTWIQLAGGVWQPVRIPFDAMRPNPYFQPPDAKMGAPLDVSDVRAMAFAPQDKTAGSLAIGRFVVSK